MIDALLLTLLGMGTVFVVLLLISLMISGFKLIFKPNAPAPTPAQTAAPAAKPVVSAASAAPAGNDEEIVAAISAALIHHLGAGHKILSIRPAVTNNRPDSWTAAGLAENIRPFSIKLK